MQDLHSIHTHRREAAIPFPLNPTAGSGQNLLKLLNPGHAVALCAILQPSAHWAVKLKNPPAVGPVKPENLFIT